MKPGRQNIILEIITEQNIETQKQLKAALAARGIKSTQATLSRDIKDLRLVKELGANGFYHYSVAAKPEIDDSSLRLKKILRESVISFDTAQNIVVIKTIPGLAPAVGSAIDNMNIEQLVGTLAGDDTCFVAMKNNESAEKVIRQFRENL